MPKNIKKKKIYSNIMETITKKSSTIKNDKKSKNKKQSLDMKNSDILSKNNRPKSKISMRREKFISVNFL